MSSLESESKKASSEKGSKEDSVENHREEGASKSGDKKQSPLLEKFLVAGFLVAVPVVLFAVTVAPWKGSSSSHGLLGGGQEQTSNQKLPEVRQTGSLEDKLQFVGPDAPLTQIVPVRSIHAPQGADEAMPLEKWSNGRIKVSSREWSFENRAIEEVCFFDQEETALGCGVYRDGEKFEGIFVRWGTPLGKLAKEATVLREIVSFKDGLKDGISRAYRFDGSPLLETTFLKGQQVHKRVFRQQGNEVVDLGTHRVEGLPESRRSRNTVD